MTNASAPGATLRSICRSVLPLWVVLLSLSSVNVFGQTLCVNTILSGGVEPNPDGTIAGDQGWATAFQYTFGNAMGQPHAVVHMTRSATHLYVAFEINNDPQYNAEDVLILLLGPSSDATQDRRIHIHPVSNSGNGTNEKPMAVKAWDDSGAWPTQAHTPDELDPAWIYARVTAAGAGPFSYFVEAAIDLAGAGITLPAAPATFRVHFNVLRIYKTSVGGIDETHAVQFNWPELAAVPGVPANPTASELMSNPPRASWGEAVQSTPGAQCQGIRVKDVYINNPANKSVLSIPPVSGSVTNNYFVEIENAGGSDAGHILATIHAWRFGIASNQFGKVPASPNPVSTFSTGGAAIAPGSVRTVTMAWPITHAEYTADYAGNAVVCSLVQLDVDNAQTAGVTRTLIGNR
jgi:hypothetical protein